MAVEAAESVLDRLKQLVPLNTLPDKELKQLLDATGVETLKKGGVLFEQGDTDPKNVYLLAGKVDLIANRKVVDTIESGSETANFALAHRFPRELTARARTKIDYISIDSRALGEAVERCRQDAFKVGDFDSDASDDWMSQLLRSQAFQHIPPANLQRVMISMEEIEVEKGAQVVTQGDPGDYFYLINRGECAVLRTLPNSDESVELARLGPGQSFGEESLLSGGPRGSSVTMLTDGVLLRLAKDDFVELVKNPLARYVSYKDAKTLVEGGGAWLDVRVQEEYEANHLNGAINVPINSLRFQATSLAKDRRHIVYCNDGRLSDVAAYLLTEREFEVYALEGGLAKVPREVFEQPEEEEEAAEPPGEKGGRVSKREFQEAAEKLKKAEAEVKSLEIRLAEREKAIKRHVADAEQALELWMDQQKDVDQDREKQAQRLKEMEALCAEQAEQIKEFDGVRSMLDSELNEVRGQLGEQSTASEKVDEIRHKAEERERDLEFKLQYLEGIKEEQLEKINQLEQAHEAQLGEQEQARTSLEKELDEARGQLEDQAGRLEVFEGQAGKLEELEETRASLEQERDGQAAKLSTLEQEQSELKRELESARSALESQASAGDELAKVRQELESKLSELEQERDAQTFRVDELEQSQAGLTQELEEARSQLASQTSAGDELATVRQELEAKLSELEQERDAQASRVDELEQSQSSLTQDLEETRSQLASQASTGDEVAAVRQELEAKLTEIEQERDEQTTRIGELEQSQTALTQELEGARSRLAAQASAGDEVAAVRQELEAKLSELEQERDSQVSRVSELEQTQTDLTQALEEARSQLGSQVSAGDEVAAVRQELEAKLSELEQERKQALEQLDEQKGDQQTLEAELETLREERKDLEAQLETAQQQAEAQAGERAEGAGDEALQQEIESLKVELEMAQMEAVAKAGQVEAELEEMRLRMEEAQARAEEAAKASGEDATEQLALQQEVEDLRWATKQRQQELEKAIQDQRNLEDALEDRAGQLERAGQELDDLKEEQLELETRQKKAEEERAQAETALAILQEKVDSGVLASERVEAAPPPPTAVAAKPRSAKAMIVAVLAGAIFSFVVLDALMLLSGKGEIISSLTEGEPKRQLVEAEVEAEETFAEEESEVSAQAEISPTPEPKPAAVAKAEEVKKPAKAEKKKDDFASSIGRELRDRMAGGGAAPVMVRLSEGKFTMGSNRSLLAKDERPAHTVELKAFYMGRYEVTFEEYDRFAKSTGRALPDDKGWGRGKRPVINVTWEDAAAYAKWLSKQTGRSYRLPTEAEWEYAAAGGQTKLFWWGYDLEEGRANCFNCGGEWAGKKTAPVGSFDPNPYGLHNTAGNVMEWVQDCYKNNYRDAPEDGSAWEGHDCNQRVIRGGAYNKPGDSMRTTKRHRLVPDSKLSALGFRLVREQ